MNVNVEVIVIASGRITWFSGPSWAELKPSWLERWAAYAHLKPRAHAERIAV